MTESCDYLIIGGGAAGCVLANRLSADGKHRVLVLEAGGRDWHPWIKIPAGFTRTIFNPAIGWRYQHATSPDTADRVIPCPRGRVLGGSSSINGHLYVRGQRDDYDGWAAGGAEGWSWDEVLPYFKRAETRIDGNPQWRGTTGPLSVTDPVLQHPLCNAYFQSMAALGIERNPDFNSGDQAGCGHYQYLMKNGRRWSAADAYLKPVLGRDNLELQLNCHVCRLNFSGTQVIGVTYRRTTYTGKPVGPEISVSANAEVILAAGAINTPHLLQLSGIGDAARLKALGIPVIYNVPAIGDGLSDHYAVRIAARLRNASDSLNRRSHWPRLLGEVLNYAIRRQGLLASAVAQAHGFIDCNSGNGRPDTQLLFTPASYESGKVGQASLEKLPGLTCGVCQLRPHSKGWVRAGTADPFAAPGIQPNYLSDKRDVENLLAGIAFVRALYSTSPLAELIDHETWPGDQASGHEELEKFARETGSTVYHPVGTCKMGVAADAPVSPQLQLKGVQGLRVVDASVMPEIVSGNTYAATIMIAERGADFILADNNAR